MGVFFPKYIVKKSLEFFNFLKVGVGEGVILFIPRTVSKHKRQLLPQQSMCYFAPIKRGGSQPHPLKSIFSKYH